MKRIANIVFYKFNGERPNMKQACIFYTDGTVKNTSYEDGLEACQEIVAANNIRSKAAFKEMINNRAVYVMSGKEFEERFQSFISREDVSKSEALIPVQPQNTDIVSYQKVYKPMPRKTVDNTNNVSKKENGGLGSVVVPQSFVEEIEDEIEEQEDNNDIPVINPIVENSTKENRTEETPLPRRVNRIVTPVEVNNDSNGEAPAGNETRENRRGTVVPPIVVNRGKEEEPTDDSLDNDFVDSLDEDSAVIPPVSFANNEDVSIEEEGLEDEQEVAPVVNNTKKDSRRVTPIVPPVKPVEKETPVESVEDYNIEDEDFDDEYEENFEDGVLFDDGEAIDADIEDFEDDFEEEKKDNKFVAWIKRGVEKIKNMKLVKKITAFALAIAIGLGLYSCSQRQTKEGEMLNSNLTTASQDADLNMDKRGGHLFLIYGNNDHWNDYSFEELQKVNVNEEQKDPMKAAQVTLEAFNGEFANAHVEEGKDVKPALTFDEMMALQQAYNSYTKEQIRAIFNGASVNAGEMGRAYRDANLQLMGAYVIGTRENPVDMSGIIESKEGKEFYQRYYDLFLDAKEATGEDKLKKIELFYKAVREDFPVTDKVRTEGIAHADDYATIEPYKLSVTPMIAAAEIMFQNYEVDYTLNDSEVDFLNDLGLCNFADDTFQRIETITLTSEEDNKNPLYSQYRDAIIYMLKLDGNYYVDDEHRELTKLDAFQEQVNWHAFEGRWVYSSYTYYTTETHTETKTWTETETTTRVEETREEKPITEEAKKEVDEQIEKENEKAKEEAEKEAEETRKEMQEEANKEAEKIEEEVKEDAKDLEEKIEDANEQIDQNNSDDDKTNDKPVNEDDLGHGVQFDDQHQDGNGNLNDSVENITTDPRGDETDMDFPDPNETGKAFDEAGEAMNNDGFSGDGFTVEEEPKAAATETNVRRVNLTDEELIDLYIDYLAKQPSSNEFGYQYRK